MDPSGVARRQRQRAFRHSCDAVAIDVLHGEDVDAGRADLFLLALIEIADPHEHRVLGQHRGHRPDRRELQRFPSEQGREWHAVHVAALGRRRRVHVAMGVHPDQAKRLQ